MCRLCDLLSENLSAQEGTVTFRAELWHKTLHLQSGPDTVALLGYFLAQTLAAAPDTFSEAELMAIFRDGMQTGGKHFERAQELIEEYGDVLPPDGMVFIEADEGQEPVFHSVDGVVPTSKLN